VSKKPIASKRKTINKKSVNKKSSSKKDEGKEKITHRSLSPAPPPTTLSNVKKKSPEKGDSKKAISAESPYGVGLDMGTSNIVGLRDTSHGPERMDTRNAFLYIHNDEETRNFLSSMDIAQVKVKEKTCVLGRDAFDFSNFLERVTQRTMSMGVINPLEREAIRVLNMIVQDILWEPRINNEFCCFSLPADPIDSNIDIIYHKNILETMIACLGFRPYAINEAYAVILSELKDEKFTGIGVSCGGGMVNICLTYKAIIIAEFAIARGGDWIDLHAANVLDMPSSKVTFIKEEGINIASPKGREASAIAIYYKQYIHYFLEQIANVFHLQGKNPQFDEPIDIVFAGGSTMVRGFIEVVRNELQVMNLGVPINQARMAKDPFLSVSKGCLYNAQQLNNTNSNK